MRKTPRLSVLLIAVLIAAGIQGLAPQSALAHSRKTIKVGIKSAGKRIVLHRGQKLRISLSSNGTTGYVWRLSGKHLFRLRLKSRTYKPSSSAVPGASGTETWVFKARRRGSVTLRLKYLQPWESRSVAKRFVLRIRVR
jgi:predicted secreted protein